MPIPSTNRFVIAIALATILAAAPIGIADHGFGPTPDTSPQDCDGNTDIHGDGIGYYHHYVVAVYVKTGEDIAPVEIDEGTPGVSFGDGQDDNIFTEVIVRDGNQGACPDETDPVTGPRGVGHRDGELEWGIGGAWLNAQHHSGEVCIDDAILGSSAEFIIVSDADGDGFTELAQDKATGCDTITVSPGMGPVGRGAAGPQEGWWVIVQFGTFGNVWTTSTSAPTNTPPPSCGADELIGPKGKRRAGGQGEFVAGATVGIKVGAGRVLVAEGVTQTGGPAGNPGHIEEEPHAGTGEGTVHTWQVSASRDFNTRTYSYAFTTSCPADDSFATYSGTFYVYN